MGKQLLLVEGKDDLHVFSHLFKIFKIEEKFEIKDAEGDKIFSLIEIAIKADNERIGIVLDADTNINSKWHKVVTILKKYGYNCPSMPNTEGVVLENNKYQTIGVWLMPDNVQNGMLEDFVYSLVPSNDMLMPHVETALLKIEALNLNKYKLIHKAKAKIHTWLAWQEEPGTPMGLAIGKTYLETKNDICLRFITWIKKLYD